MMSKTCKAFKIILLPIAAAMIAGGCDSAIYDDIDPCPTDFRVRFRYDYNMKYADAFSNEVTSVNVWAFDKQGKLVWSGSDSGASLSGSGYSLSLPVAPGSYDIVSWCGLKDNIGFTLGNYTPVSPQDLSVGLNLRELSRSGEQICDTRLPGLFHAIATDVVLTSDPSSPSTQYVDLSLTKDTHYLQVLLQNLDGTAMKSGDFSFRVTARDSRLEYTNLVAPGQPQFSYLPWNVLYGETGMTGGTVSLSSLLAEMTLSRLMTDSRAELIVTRNSDGRDIIRIPLVDYLLLIKGNYREMTDQEFLDREDEYRLTFFIDGQLNWYVAAGIYINNWAVVPPQNPDL